jgi:hypothetical protein
VRSTGASLSNVKSDNERQFCHVDKKYSSGWAETERIVEMRKTIRGERAAV